MTELAVVIGKISKNLDKDNWMDSVLGFTSTNDLSERILQGQDGSFNGNFTRAKTLTLFVHLVNNPNRF